MKQYDIAAYIWPSYHHEPRMAHIWTEGDGEWYTVRRATPRFPGHAMPRVPLLGYQDEADPEVMREHVALGAEYGVNTFIMDWYWYDNAPCFERQLNDGLIPALQGSDSRFFLMWANHDANTTWDMHTDAMDLLWPGTVDRSAFETVGNRVLDQYLKRETYYRIHGAPVFCIYYVANLVAGLGGLAATQDALAWLRDRVVQAGLPGLHLQAIQMNSRPVDVADKAPDVGDLTTTQMIQRLGFDSVTYYQYVHAAGGQGEYGVWAEQATAGWAQHAQDYPLFFPHVSIGWDNTMRMPSNRKAVTGSSPDAFRVFLRQAKAFADASPDQPPLITINSWNEWTEGSYLLPDELWGYGYLEAVRDVFYSDGAR